MTMKLPLAVLKHAMLIALSLCMIYPILWLFLGSFKANNEIFAVSSVWPTEFIWSNYAKGWSAVPGFTFADFFLNSITISTLVVVGSIISCCFVAFPFARMVFPLKGFCLSCCQIASPSSIR